MNLTFNIPSKQSGSQQSVVGKLGTSLFFLVFGSFAVFFIFLMSRDLAAKLRMYKWTRTGCVIISSASVDLGKEYGFNVQYDYEFAGHLHRGTDHTVGKSKFSDYRDVQILVARYQPGVKSTCYVNPSDPTQAVLRRGSLAMIPFFLFPLVFVAIGAGGIYFTWRKTEKTAVDAGHGDSWHTLAGALLYNLSAYGWADDVLIFCATDCEHSAGAQLAVGAMPRDFESRAEP